MSTTNLGTITGRRQEFGFVGNSDPIDRIDFNLPSAGALNLGLTGLSADADLRLFRGSSSSPGSLVQPISIRGGTTPDSINHRNLAAGNYFAQVSRFGSANTNYRLRLSRSRPSDVLAEEQNLGTLGTTSITRTGNVGDNDTSDIYRFSLSSGSGLNATLTNLSTDADLRIVRDANNNGFVDSGEVVASSTPGGTTPSAINLRSLGPGTYFAQVYQFSGNTNYRLQLSTSRLSNLIAEEQNLGTLGTSAVTRTGNVGDNDTSDIYRFSLAGNRRLNATLSGLSSDADLRVIRDANNNGFVDGGDVVAISTRGGTSTDSIDRILGPGNYFAQVYQFSGNTNYNLRLQARIPQVRVTINEVRAIDTNTIDPGVPIPLIGTIGRSPADFYPEVRIAGSNFGGRSLEIENRNRIFPNWQFSQNVTSSLVPIRVQIWDRDGGLRGADDHIDINPSGGRRDLNLTYNLLTNNITGDVSGRGGQLLSSSGGGDSDRASIRFRIEIV